MKKLRILLFVIVFALLNSCCLSGLNKCPPRFVTLSFYRSKDADELNKDDLKKIIAEAIKTEKIKIILNNKKIDLKLSNFRLYNNIFGYVHMFEYTHRHLEVKNNILEVIINNKKITINYEKFKDYKDCDVFKNFRIISNDGIEYETLPDNIQGIDVWKGYIKVHIKDVNLLSSVEKSSL